MKLAHLPGRIFTALATLGPLGTRMPAPGTWGSFAGLLLYAVGLRYFNDAAHWPTFLAVAVVLVIVSVAVCTIAEKHLNKKDPGEIILDEVVAMPLVYIGAEGFIRDASQPWAWVIVGFVLFRIFDVAKPFGIKKLQDWPGGIGVVADDIAAAAASCLVLHGLHWGVVWLG